MPRASTSLPNRPDQPNHPDQPNPDPDRRSCTVLYFAAASSFTGLERETFPAPVPLIRLLAQLETRYPGFRRRLLDSCLVTVNLDYVDVPGGGGGGAGAGAGAGGQDDDDDDGLVIQPDDEVAIIPPVSSG